MRRAAATDGGAMAQNPDRNIDVRDLGDLLRRKRSAARLTLREVEGELNHALTASSLSRIENGAVPDSKNVPALASWLGIPLHLIGFTSDPAPEAVDTPDLVEVHLRADRRLEPAAAQALSRLFRHLYDDFASGELTTPEARSEATQEE